MSSSHVSRSSTRRGGHRKTHRVRNTVLIILAVLVAALGITLLVHRKTISLATGGGNLQLNNISGIENALKSAGTFENFSTKTGADGTVTLTGVSKDGAITLSVVQKKDGHETATAEIDLKKLDTGNVSKSALLHGDTTAIKQTKGQADKLLVPLVGADQAAGIEAYLAPQALKQSRSNPSAVNINHQFGETDVTLTGNLSDKKATLVLEK